MGNPHVTAVELAWFAAIWEAEGSLSLCVNNSNYNAPTFGINFVNKDAYIIDAFLDIAKKIGVNFYVGHTQPKQYRGTDDRIYRLHLRKHAQLTVLLTRIKPFIRGTKIKRINLMLELLTSRLGKKYLNNTDKGYTTSEKELVERFRTTPTSTTAREAGSALKHLKVQSNLT